MRTIGRFTYSLFLFVFIPASVLFIVYQVTDKSSEQIDNAFNSVKSHFIPNEEDHAELVLPLLKAQNNTQSEAVKIESFTGQQLPTSTEEVITPTQAENEITALPIEYHDQTFTENDILEDKLNRLPGDFKITPEFKKRVGFWLDIYTKYSSRFVIIHDQDHPWLIYKIVDLRPVYQKPGHRFTKDANDKKAVAKAKAEVRQILQKLAHKKSFQNLTAEELKVYTTLEALPGSRNKVFRNALLNMREQRGQKNFFKSGLISSAKYLSEMEEIFARYDLPSELVRLPLVESSFNEEAQSKVGASGIWQFMPVIGKKFLNMADHSDERNSPIKATEAAAKLFRGNYKILKNWPLAITAYNHGASGLIKARAKLKTSDLGIFIEKHQSKSFSFASKNFYSEFMAALYAEKYQEEVFGTLAKNAPLAADTIKLRKSMRVKDIADVAGITLEEIKLHNPDLKKQIISRNPFLPMGYKIRLPLGRSARLELYYQEKESAKNSKG